LQVSQKCQYTIRALFELAKRKGGPPAAVGEIAAAQAIPLRFLEVILQGLRSGGQIESRRGNRGGYVLAVPPESITVGSVIRAVDGSLAPVRCIGSGGDDCCPLQGRCPFQSVWRRAQEAAEQIYDATTLKDLVDGYRAAECPEPDYCV
jgi:Rrf2 family cysteine metabolism transcriptional repressor